MTRDREPLAEADLSRGPSVAAVTESWTPLVLAVAPNGARKSKNDHPALPMTAPEIARCAAECVEAGATMIHLHVRNRQGRHILDAGAYREAITAVRREVGERLVIQVTTEAIGLYRPEQQMSVVRDLHPEAVSLSLGELLPDPTHEKPAAEFLTWLRDEGILSQFILYSGWRLGHQPFQVSI